MRGISLRLRIRIAMRTKIIILTLLLSAAIWFAVNWFMSFMGVKDYGFLASNMIVCVVYLGYEQLKIE